jgi:hypothetical protein
MNLAFLDWKRAPQLSQYSGFVPRPYATDNATPKIPFWLMVFKNISLFHQLRALPKRCPRMTWSTNSSPNRRVNGPERNNMR